MKKKNEREKIKKRICNIEIPRIFDELEVILNKNNKKFRNMH